MFIHWHVLEQGDRVRRGDLTGAFFQILNTLGRSYQLLLLVKIWVDGILAMVIEVYVLRDQNGCACDFFFSTCSP